MRSDSGRQSRYRFQFYYVGLSSTQLAESSVGYEAGADYNLKRHYYVTAGLTKRLSPTVELKPSVFSPQKNVQATFD